jgi:hypothetical protein
MTDVLTQSDLPFLAEAMQAAKQRAQTALLAAAPAAPAPPEQIPGGAMSIPKPVSVDANSDMSADDFKACSTIMSVVQNMVQKTLTDAAAAANVPLADALVNMDAWVQAYVDFPFPFFNFSERQSDVYKKDNFSLSVDPEVVENFLSLKGVAGLKDAVLGALKKSNGVLVSYEGTDRNFNYFGVVTTYRDAGIDVRLIKFQMLLKTTNVKALCVTFDQTNFSSAYDTFKFTADTQLMLAMQKKMGDKLVDYFANQLLNFAASFYDDQMKNFKTNMTNLLKKPRT